MVFFKTNNNNNIECNKNYVEIRQKYYGFY